MTKDARALSERQRAIHVLNRLGFGPRPGDVEKVRQLGLDKYLEQQLYPGNLKDDIAEAKIKKLADACDDHDRALHEVSQSGHAAQAAS
ncbi:MAG: DUF1800 family protein [Pyrinomonadaceae bacterium]